MKKSIFTLIALFQFSIAAFAINYYISPTGTGDGNSPESPCDLATGYGKLANNSNDTLFVRGGVYDCSSKLSIDKVGTADCRIAIFAYKDEKPILDFRKQRYGDRGVSLHQNSRYLHLKGLTIRYAGDNGLYSDGSYHIVENCVFYGNSDSGCQFKTGCGNLILNCDSYDNFDYQTGGSTRADFGGNADGFADKQYTNTGEPNIYDGCRAWGNSDDGWDFFQKVGNTIIRNSFCYANGPTTYDMTNHPRYNTDKAWFDSFPLTVTDRYGETVTIPLDKYTNYGNGNGFKVGGELTAHNVRLEHCLATNNRVRGFDQNNNAGEMILLNCTSFGNAPNYGFNNRDGGRLTVTNCVSLNGKSGDNFRTQTVVSIANNAWNTSGVSCTAADFINATEVTQMIAPRKADGSLPDMTFMHLVEGSDLIDNGVNVGLPFGGVAPDFGCFEFGNAMFYPSVVSTPDNRNQSVNQNVAITDIVFTWSGSATGLKVSELPEGVDFKINTTAKTLTIFGSPSAMGKFDYTVTTLQEEDNPMEAMSVSGKIIVKSANAKQIAFVTVPNSPEDNLILEKLNDNVELNVTIIDAAAVGTNFNAYDLIILSATPNSGLPGLAPSQPLNSVNKPKLILKPFQLQNTRWNWLSANAVNPSPAQSTMVISDKSHEIFTGLEFTGVDNNELVLFSAINTNAVTGVQAGTWRAASVDVIGTAKGSTTQSLVEIPVGTSVNNTVINSRFLMIGLSEYSTEYLTPTATQLIENACYYLMGVDIPSDINDVKSDQLIVKQENGQISIEGIDNVVSLTLYNITGRQIANSHSAILPIPNISRGVYILTVRTADSVISRKIVL
ncbi:MAG: right-handed parallel beta-helix repeat-containing protein [Prevotellaceae bacterium]|nr:right-handed parallel beta-helix repeat-containing protein [Prevotellaceae bacterium]